MRPAAAGGPRWTVTIGRVSEVLGLEDVEAARERALAVLRAGRLLVAPTDSIYALVADAFSKQATQRLFGAKRRGRATPLTVLIRSPRQTTGMVEVISEPAERLMAVYWPGPLTLVFRAVEGLTWDIGDTRGSVSLRMPTDDFLLDLIAEIGPLAVTSANRRGEPVPTNVAQARKLLGLSAGLYLDGGERAGPTSTIVDVTRDQAEVLREGAIPAADIEQVATGAVAWGTRPGPSPDPPPAAEPDGAGAAGPPVDNGVAP